MRKIERQQTGTAPLSAVFQRSLGPPQPIQSIISASPVSSSLPFVLRLVCGATYRRQPDSSAQPPTPAVISFTIASITVAF
ncbi:Uncharacterized protein HZ326_16364 [Fusarium oxysporum f. sp. albedinis]|nr:Uncharacterized protein HZ326_16364 [Fusarium oxysporum f. sp. albedinis]